MLKLLYNRNMNKKLAIGFVVIWLLVTAPAVVILVSKKHQPTGKPQEPQNVYGMPLEYELAKRKKRFEQEIAKSPHTPENLLKLVNAERAKVGVKPLKLDERLNRSAKMKVDDMVKYQYLAHKNHDGTRGTDYIAKVVGSAECPIIGENASGGTYDTGNDIVQSYMDSKRGHKEAILNPKAKLIGFNTQQDGRFTRNVMHFCKDE